jgi:hypothetical protein
MLNNHSASVADAGTPKRTSTTLNVPLKSPSIASMSVKTAANPVDVNLDYGLNPFSS